VPVRVNCPHCRTPCLVAEHHLGVPVNCGRCARSFTTAAPPLVSLDIGAAASASGDRPRDELCFLVRRLSWCNLDEPHELAVVVIANGKALRTAGTALTPMLNMEAAASPEALTSTCKALSPTAAAFVIRDGEVQIVNAGGCPLYHHRAGRLAQVTPPLKLAAGDWLLVSPKELNSPGVQTEISKSASSAVDLAQRLAELSPDQIAVAVRCY